MEMPECVSIGIVNRVVASCLFMAALTACHSSPDLTPEMAATLISSTPEFNRTFRLSKVAFITRQADSLADCCYYGLFTFQYLNAPAQARPVKAWADFRFLYGEWHLEQFTYGCDHSGLDPEMRATDCHIVHL